MVADGPVPSRAVTILSTSAALIPLTSPSEIRIACAPAVESSLVKELGTRFEQDVVTAINAVIDEAPNMADTSAFARLLITATLAAPSFTIRGGTNEVLRSVAAKGLQPSGGKR